MAIGKAIEELLPDGFEYCIYVHSPGGELQWSFSSIGFDWKSAAASYPYPVSSAHNPDPCFVTLAISR
ncbi:MAG: hypothetical protein H5T33_00455 [Candidatus Methanosuratus sp.]|nr:hypothetical protein [Candidatus Methanosuratincola sp.]